MSEPREPIAPRFRVANESGPLVVENPELRRLVSAARAVPTPAVAVEPEQLHAAWKARRDRRRTVIGGLMAAAAVVALGIGVALRPSSPTADSPESIVRGETDRPMSVPAAGDAASAPRPIAIEPSAGGETRPARLAATVSVRLEGGFGGGSAAMLGLDESEPEVVDARRVRLPAGSWAVENIDPQPVRVDVPDGHFVLHRGVLRVEIAADVTSAASVEGQVERYDREGRPVTLTEIHHVEDAPVEPTADELAARAEAQWGAGRRSAAIATLRRLARRHPTAGVTATALLDLGRLLEQEGQPDDARCAYAVFLQRWPGHALAGDVRKAKAALGQGPKCRGLRAR